MLTIKTKSCKIKIKNLKPKKYKLELIAEDWKIETKNF